MEFFILEPSQFQKADLFFFNVFSSSKHYHIITLHYIIRKQYQKETLHFLRLGERNATHKTPALFAVPIWKKIGKITKTSYDLDQHCM